MGNLKVSTSDRDWNPKMFWMFAGLFVIAYMLSIILTAKVFMFKGIVLTVGIFAFPIVCILGDVLTEVYGFNNARKVIWLGFIANIFLILLTQLAMVLPAALDPNIDTAFTTLFSLTPRIVVASLTAYLVGEFVNSYVVSKMKVKQEGKNFGIRAIASTIVGQFFDTIIVIIIAFYGVLPVKDLYVLALSSWVIKVLYEVIVLPLTILTVRYVKHKEGVEHFDKEEISLI